MSLTPAMIDAMVQSGCTAEQIAAVVKASMAEDEQRLADKRAKDAERQRRHRASRDVTVTECDSVTEPPLSRPPNEIKSNPPTHTPGIKTPRTRKAEIPLPEDWAPKPFGLNTESRKIVDGWPPGELERQAEHFRASHTAKGNRFADWQQAWATWVLNHRNFNRVTNIQPSFAKSGSTAETARRVRERVGILR